MNKEKQNEIRTKEDKKERLLQKEAEKQRRKEAHICSKCGSEKDWCSHW